MLTQQQNDALGEDTEEFYAEMEMEMLKASSHKLSDLEPDDTGKIPWLAIIGAAAALYAVHRGIVNRYASNVGPHVSRDVYGGFMLNAATELSGAEQNAEAILNDARQTAQTVAPIITQAIQNRSQFIVNQANAAYLKEAARAAQMVGRGTNAKDAVASAVSALARQGVTYSTYTRVVNGVPQTVKVPVDVGIRREIRTEMCQRLANQVIGIAEQTGDNLVEVDFSTNPRESHAEWEGQIYQLNGSGEYQNFYIACRWGDMVDGYGGYNCQHNIAIYRGYRHFTDPLKGTGYTREEARELTARQRYYENEIRKDRRERDVLREVGLPTASVNARLSNHKRQLDQLVSSHSVLYDQTWRTTVYAAASKEERRVAAARAEALRASRADAMRAKAEKIAAQNESYKYRKAMDGLPEYRYYTRGRPNLRLNEQKYEEHNKVSQVYKDRAAKMKADPRSKWDRPSYLTIGRGEVKALIDRYHGTGIPQFYRTGKWDHTEMVLGTDIIGYDVKMDGSAVPTRAFLIHYSKTKGVHIVPLDEEEYFERLELGR